MQLKEEIYITIEKIHRQKGYKLHQFLNCVYDYDTFSIIHIYLSEDLYNW